MSVGLVLEGGSMRGMFTCGIIDVFMEKGIEIDVAVGVSAGAVFGCNMKSRQIGRGLRYNKKYCKDKRYASLRNLIKTGNLFDVDFCYRKLPYELDPWDIKTFSENPMDFYVVATDAKTGKAVYHKCKDGKKEDIVWLRASASVPVVSRAVPIGEGRYYDGGMADSIPLQFMEAKGYDKIIVIETQPFEYVKKPLGNMWFIKRVLKKYPNMLKTMAERHKMYNAQKKYVRKREQSGEVFVLRPKEPLNIGLRPKDPAELDRVYQLGRSMALERLSDIKAYIEA